jgi:PST family polysaccharide transporter
MIKLDSVKNIDYFNSDSIKTDLKKQAIRGAGTTVLSRFFIYFIQMLSTIFLARLLTPDDFGLVAMVTVFSMILVEFGLLRLNEATIQKEHITHIQISALFWINLALCLIISLFFMGLSPLIAWFYGEPRLINITIAIGITFIFSGLSTQHMALMQRNMQFAQFTANQIVATIITEIVAVIMALKGFGYWALVVRRILPQAAISVGAWILCRWRPGIPKKTAGVLPMLKFGMSSLGNYFTNYISRSVDKLLIGHFYGTTALGYYDKAYQLFVMPLNQLTYPLTNVAVATLSRLIDEPDKFRRYYLEAVSKIAFIGMLLSVVLSLIGNDFIVLLLGSKWIKTGEIFSLLAPSIGVTLIYSTHGWLHLSLGKPDRWFRWGIVASAIVLICIGIGLQFNIIGVALGYTASFFILFWPGLWYAGKPAGISVSSILFVSWKYGVAALVTYLISRFIFIKIISVANFLEIVNLPIKIIISACLSTCIYLLCIVIFYQSVKPIFDIFSLIHQMLPSRISFFRKN